ncbi:MAG: DUF1127 domain-containing protein [Rhizobiales bacterium]|nr:DUF1127 domain-containing protein [Hyphomicrobiales bacterium]
MFTASILRPRNHKQKLDRVLHPGVLHHAWARIGSELGEWRRRLRDRRALAAMSDRSLRDIGLTRYDAACEASKPFWRA